MKRIIVILTVMIVLTLSFNTAAFQVIIPSQVEVSSEQITLAEIAKIEAPELSTSALENIENLVLKAAPNPGYSKRLSRILVDLSIKNMGYQASNFSLKMPKTVIVKRKSTLIKAEEIFELTKSYLKSKFNFKDAQIIIESKSPAKSIKIPAGDYELKIDEKQNLSFPNLSLKLEIWQHENKIKNIFYPVKISLKTKVLTANKKLARNSKLKKSDFEREEKIVSGNLEKIVRDYAEIDFNKVQLTRDLNQGEVLNKSYLKIPYVVKWGQKLNLRVKVNNIKISTLVKAKERGKIGDIIKVENLRTGYDFQVLVISPTEVKLISD
ncbi:flagellar basal body P-ring formation chaperone FlgA [Halanaerobium praevalens]|uniref:Flagella basal body P-ring formation protein FlgA n=1 Tax=Halanaerobium praevalens (strain ATCC 33744 / DSM 2228 / GSL) TaxID=572479 RepID=E3DPQ2_HALPG|nr:flagellar basal body P-ring formation chaperone FlgA [Halanaerobium praevalens]ADO76727.1 flagella basal body P-ring formation protein FlgA [Halanaerobium praevalens DSM 2228]